MFFWHYSFWIYEASSSAQDWAVHRKYDGGELRSKGEDSLWSSKGRDLRSPATGSF
jgi:hypothetical protein